MDDIAKAMGRDTASCKERPVFLSEEMKDVFAKVYNE